MAKIHPHPPMPLLADPPLWNDEEAAEFRPVEVGRSLLGNAINLYHAARANLLVMGGVHGDELEGIFLAHLLLGHQSAVPVLPCLNPDGTLLHQRWNAHNVDLNRNLPTPDWKPEAQNPRYPPGRQPASEPETRAFLAALERVRPSMVLSLHSFRESFLEVERPPESLPESINRIVADLVQALGIERRNSIGYPTPGALGSYGWAQGLLVFTLELRRGTGHGELHALLPALLSFVERVNRERFKP